MTVVNNNPARIGSPTRETSSVSIKLVKLPAVPDAQKVVVKKDDTLWDIAAARLGAGAKSAQVARYIEVIKKKNPDLCSPLRDGGNRLYAGDEIEMPPTNWLALKPKGRPTDQFAAVAEARAQNDANAALSQQTQAQEKTTLRTNLEAAIAFASDKGVQAKGLNAGQKNLINALLGKAERTAPEFRDLTKQLKEIVGATDPGTSSFEGT